MALIMVDHCSCHVAALEQPACSGLKQHVLIKRHSHLDSNEREKHCQNQRGKRKLPDYFCLGFFAELTFFVSPFGTRTASSLEGHRNLIAATVIKSQRGIDSGVNRPSMEAAGRTQSLLFLHAKGTVNLDTVVEKKKKTSMSTTFAFLDISLTTCIQELNENCSQLSVVNSCT